MVKEAFSDVEWKQVTDIHVKEKSVRINLQSGDVILARSILKKAGMFSPPSLSF